MIIREWRARASESRADAYPRHFRNHVLPELRGRFGFLGASLCRRPLNGNIEFVVLTRWRSIDGIRDFAGGDVAHPVVEPDAVAALLEFDATVQHYEVIEDTGSSYA